MAESVEVRHGINWQMSKKKVQAIESLSTGKPGDILTDEQCAKIMGVPCGNGSKGRAILHGAIQYVTKHYGIVWTRRHRANCIECLAPSQIVDLSKSDQRKIHRATKRSLSRINAIDVDALSERERTTVMLRRAQIGTLVAFSSTDASKQLEARGISDVPPLGKLLEAMVPKKPD